MSRIMAASPRIIFPTLTDAVTENVTFLTSTYKERKRQCKFSNEYAILEMFDWPNYFWFAIGLGIGVLMMLIIHSNLYCQVCCPNSPILRRIRAMFRISWHRFIIWFRQFCLRRQYHEYRFPNTQENVIIMSRQQINTPNLQTISSFPHYTSRLTRIRSQFPQQSQLLSPRIPQMSDIPRLPKLSNQPQSLLQQSQLPLSIEVGQSSHTSQQVTSIPISERLLGLVKNNPSITTSPTDALVRTTISSMVATSTTTSTARAATWTPSPAMLPSDRRTNSPLEY